MVAVDVLGLANRTSFGLRLRRELLMEGMCIVYIRVCDTTTTLYPIVNIEITFKTFLNVTSIRLVCKPLSNIKVYIRYIHCSCC